MIGYFIRTTSRAARDLSSALTFTKLDAIVFSAIGLIVLIVTVPRSLWLLIPLGALTLYLHRRKGGRRVRSTLERPPAAPKSRSDSLERPTMPREPTNDSAMRDFLRAAAYRAGQAAARELYGRSRPNPSPQQEPPDDEPPKPQAHYSNRR